MVEREREPRDEAHLQELLIKGAVSLHSLTGLLGLGGQGLRHADGSIFSAEVRTAHLEN